MAKGKNWTHKKKGQKKRHRNHEPGTRRLTYVIHRHNKSGAHHLTHNKSGAHHLTYVIPRISEKIVGISTSVLTMTLRIRPCQKPSS